MDPTLTVCAAFMRNHPLAAARRLESLAPGARAELLALTTGESAARAFEQLMPEEGARTLAAMEGQPGARLLAALAPDAQVAVLRLVAHPAREVFLEALDAAVAEPLRRLLRYPPGTVGDLMDPRVFAVPDDVTVGEALKRARDASLEISFYVYVLDRSHRIAGVASLKHLLRARRADLVSAVMERRVAALRAPETREEMVRSPHWREFHTLPVTDENDRYLGAVRYETVARVRDEVAQAGGGEGLLDTALALGELYWMGLAGVMDGISGRDREAPGPDKNPRQGGPDA